MEEIDYGALFGTGAGGNEQEAAAPAPAGEQTEAQGAKEQEVAAPAGGEDTAQTGEGAQAGAAQERTAQEQKRQTPEENAIWAAARRKTEAERDAAVARAKAEAAEEARRAIDEAFAGAGLEDPWTGRPITNKAEYDAWRERFDAERSKDVREKAGMTQEEWDRYVGTLPEVVKARRAEAQAQEAQRKAAEAEAKAKVEEQLRQISALDPAIRTLDDLTGMPNYPEFYERVKRGMTLTEAYKLTNYDALTKAAAQASRQAAMNAAAGKDHMARTAQRGAGALSVPEDVKEMYRMLNPDATDAEIQTHYNRSRQKT